jgi:molybdopterin converting factor subunit 1
MNVDVLYFAAARDAAGSAAERVEVPRGGSVADLFALLVRRHAALATLRGVRFAVDERFADLGEPLQDGATVAVLPPVSGG